MRFEVSPQLIAEFYKEGCVEINELLTFELPLEGSFEERHNRFAKDPAFKKQFFSPGMAHIAAALSKAPALQIGLDQLYLEGELPETFTLYEITSLSKIACGLLLEPAKPARFASPEHPIARPKGPMLICCWIIPGCRYAPRGGDPLSHLLRRNGYNAGDVLTSQTHPIVKK